jgi:hypothetical protein
MPDRIECALQMVECFRRWCGHASSLRRSLSFFRFDGHYT